MLQPEVKGSSPSAEAVELWGVAVDAGLMLGIVSGSLLTLLQLPRAVWCRGINLASVSVPLSTPLYHLQQRCASCAPLAWRGGG